MASHKPLPGGSQTIDRRAARREQVAQLRTNALSAYSRNAFHMLDPRFTAPGVFHAYQTGESPGQYGKDPSLDVPEYSLDLIRRYPTMTPTEQLQVRWAVSMKQSWSYEELLEYRRVAFGQQRATGDNPWADVEPYDVSMMVRYPWLTPAQQLRVRYSIAAYSEEWTPEELAAYRQAAFSDLPFQAKFTEAGIRHLGKVGESPNASYYGPRAAASAFTQLGQAMDGLAGQAQRAGDALRALRTKMPTGLPADPSHDAARLGGWGIPDSKRISL
jgi:hypothetical protein